MVTAVYNQTGPCCRQKTTPIPNFYAVEDLARGSKQLENWSIRANKRGESCLGKLQAWIGTLLFSMVATWCLHWDMNFHPFL